MNKYTLKHLMCVGAQLGVLMAAAVIVGTGVCYGLILLIAYCVGWL